MSKNRSGRRVLLIYCNRERQPWPIMPIGLCYVASALKRRSHEVRVLDLMFEPDWPKRISRAIAEFKPEIVGLSIRNIDNSDWFENRFYLPLIRDQVVAPLRAISKALIMVGGPGVNVAPAQVLEFVGADCAVYGDGEETAAHLVESWERPDEPVALQNVIWNPERFTGCREVPEQPVRIPDLNSVAPPRIYDWINLKPYLHHGTPYPIQTKRGCAFSCSFCVYTNIEGGLYRLRSPEVVAEEIAAAKRDAGVWQFEFTDSVFNHPAGNAERICEALISRRLDVRLNSSGVNPQHFNPALLSLMEQAGFEEYSFAPDTAAEGVLRHLGKGYTKVETLEKAAQAARRSRLPVMWWFLFGLPDESAQTVAETLRFIAGHVRPGDLALCAVGVRIFPGTRLAQRAVQEGSIAPAQNLLSPCFYQPRDIALDEIHAQLKAAAARIPAILLTTETRMFNWLWPAAVRLKRLTRHRHPLWAPLPYVNRVRSGLAFISHRHASHWLARRDDSAGRYGPKRTSHRKGAGDGLNSTAFGGTA